MQVCDPRTQCSQALFRGVDGVNVVVGMEWILTRMDTRTVRELWMISICLS